MRKAGTYQYSGDLRLFVPYPLPPANPPLDLTREMMALSTEASLALGRLNELSTRLPCPERFIKAYVVKEALLSSAIEGVHTTMIDVFTQSLEIDARPDKGTALVLSYTKALDDALQMLEQQGMPISTRVILRAHETLMNASEDGSAAPGQFRKQSVRVGDLVTAPALEVPCLMSDLECYINENAELPALIKAGLAHVQFETIHPFLDGNGRIGRLLIVLIFIYEKLLDVPILYPSYYFKKYRLEYYHALDRVRTDGDFEGWVTFYLRVIRDSALDAYKRGQEIEALEAELKRMIEVEPDFARMRETAAAAIDYLFAQPVTTISAMGQAIDRVYNTAQSVLAEFVRLGFVSEHIINKRNKRYRFEKYLALLEKDYD